MSTAEQPPCAATWMSLCLNPAKSDMQMPIFGFAEFIAALAIFGVIYTITDFKYKFRSMVSATNLPAVSFWVVGAIGIGTLVSNLFFTEHYPIPDAIGNLAVWQTVMGVAFLIVICSWAVVVGRRPPVFSPANSGRFMTVVHRVLIANDEKEIAVVASELARSMSNIIRFAPDDADIIRISEIPSNKLTKKDWASRRAYTLLEIMASPKLCSAIAATSNQTAVQFFHEMTTQKKYPRCAGVFAKNLVLAMLRRSDSLVFHEENLYSHGFAAKAKFFMRAAFGNIELVEALGRNGFSSPLDATPPYDEPFTDKELKAYGRCYRMAVNSYVSADRMATYSATLARALSFITRQCMDLRFVKGHSRIYDEPAYKKFSVAVKIIEEMMTELDAFAGPELSKLHLTRQLPGFYKIVAKNMLEIVEIAAEVIEDADAAWSIQHNLVWNSFFDNAHSGPASAAIRRELIRLIMEEISVMSRIRAHHQNSKVLAMVLNVVGIVPTNPSSLTREERILQRAASSWNRLNFAKVYERNPDVAQYMLPRNTHYDQVNNEIVRTYRLGEVRLKLRPKAS